MARIIYADAEGNFSTRLQDRSRLYPDIETAISLLSKGQAKYQKHKSKDLHVFSVGPTMTMGNLAAKRNNELPQ